MSIDPSQARAPRRGPGSVAGAMMVPVTAPPEPPGFRLRPGEPLAEGLRRALTDQVNHALACAAADEDVDTAVHELRKALKRSRAVLRLLRPVVGAEAYGRENAALRDAARPWGPARDAVVLLRTAEDVAGGDRAADDPVLERLRGSTTAARAAALGTEHLREQTRRVLLEVRTRVAALTSGPAWDGAEPGPGIAWVLEKARKHLARAADHPDPELLHRWRKDVKYLAYQAGLLTGWVEEDIAELAEDLADLGSLLGDEHDLTVLAATLVADEGLSDTTRDGWLRAVEERRRAVVDEALATGAELLERAGVLTGLRPRQSRPTSPVS